MSVYRRHVCCVLESAWFIRFCFSRDIYQILLLGWRRCTEAEAEVVGVAFTVKLADTFCCVVSRVRCAAIVSQPPQYASLASKVSYWKRLGKFTTRRLACDIGLAVTDFASATRIMTIACRVTMKAGSITTNYHLVVQLGKKKKDVHQWNMSSTELVVNLGAVFLTSASLISEAFPLFHGDVID